jgi:ribonucleoside-diphosphate reductase alpha chain
MPDRPIHNPGFTTTITTGCGKIYITDNTAGEYPEIFIQMGKTGGCAQSFCQALARVASFAIRAGVPKERVIHAWKGIQCPSSTVSGGRKILSCADAIAQVLEGL